MSFFGKLKEIMNEKETDFGEPEVQEKEIERMEKHLYSDVSTPIVTRVKNREDIDAIVDIIRKSIAKVGDNYNVENVRRSWATSIEKKFTWTEQDAQIPEGKIYKSVSFEVTASTSFDRVGECSFDVVLIRQDARSDLRAQGLKNGGRIEFQIFDVKAHKDFEDIFKMKFENGDNFIVENAFGGSIIEDIFKRNPRVSRPFI